MARANRFVIPLKSTLILLWILACSAANSVGIFLLPGKKREITNWLMCRCFGGVLRILGVRVHVTGEPAKTRPLLLVTNHSSYLDIPVLGAHAPVRFTPKAEIADWPLIGHFCRQIHCIFIDRRVQKTGENQEALRQALARGELVCLFPEGTTSDGKRVLPFRSSYFSLAEEETEAGAVAVQPAAIRYTHVRGLPLDASLMPKIAWYGDMELVSHLKDLIALGPIRAELVFAEPCRAADRKELARLCHERISQIIQSN